jgi:hypothetical protein
MPRCVRAARRFALEVVLELDVGRNGGLLHRFTLARGRRITVDLTDDEKHRLDIEPALPPCGPGAWIKTAATPHPDSDDRRCPGNTSRHRPIRPRRTPVLTQARIRVLSCVSWSD